MPQENVMGAGITQLLPDRFIVNATIVSLTPRTPRGIPLQASWANADRTTGIRYETLLAAPHHAEGYAAIRMLQNSRPIGDRNTYRLRLEAALAATMLAVDRPRLMREPTTPRVCIPALPGVIDRKTDWSTLVRPPTQEMPAHACLVIPMRYMEGVVKRLWAADAAMCITTIMRTPWSPACNGISVVLVFIADREVG